MSKEREFAKEHFDKYLMFKNNPIAWSAWKIAFNLGIEYQKSMQQSNGSGEVQKPCKICGASAFSTTIDGFYCINGHKNWPPTIIK